MLGVRDMERAEGGAELRGLEKERKNDIHKTK